MSQNSLSIEPFCSPTTWKMSDIFHDLAWKISNFSVTTNSKGHLPDGTWSGTMYFVIRCHLQPLAATRLAASGRKWPLEQVTDQTCPVTASDRRGQVAASDRKWPQRASDRKWPLRSNGRKWPQVAAFGKWPRVAASGRLFQFQIPHLMQPL